MKKFHLFGIFAVVAASAVASAVILDAFNVVRKPKEGEKVSYTLTADVDLGGMAAKFSGHVVEKVVKVESDGSYKIESTQTDGKVDVGGNEQEVPSSAPSTTTYNAKGDVVTIEGTEVSGDAYRMAAFGILPDPGKSVAVGDSWTVDFKKNEKTGAVAGKGEYKVVSEEKIGAWDTLKIKATYKETEGTDPASSDGFVWVAKSDANLVKSEGKWVNAPFPGAPMPINASYKLEREATK